MSKSVKRVQAAAEAAGQAIEVIRMPESTRTAEEAAAACGCDVGQIVKSLIFQCAETGGMKLLLVAGDRQADMAKAAAVAGEPLVRADAKRVREETGFAIGGVAPIGHLKPVPTWIDQRLLDHATVWAAAGAPNAVFEIAPQTLVEMTGGAVADIAG